MLKDGQFGISIVDAEKWCRSERDRATLEPKAEAMIAKLRRGKNFFTPVEFRQLVVYLTQGGAEADEAYELGLMTFGVYEIVRVNWRADAEWVTASELAARAGKTKQHMLRLLNAADVPYKRNGNTRLYDYTMLRALWDEIASDRNPFSAVG